MCHWTVKQWVDWIRSIPPEEKKNGWTAAQWFDWLDNQQVRHSFSDGNTEVNRAIEDRNSSSL